MLKGHQPIKYETVTKNGYDSKSYQRHSNSNSGEINEAPKDKEGQEHWRQRRPLEAAGSNNKQQAHLSKKPLKERQPVEHNHHYDDDHHHLNNNQDEQQKTYQKHANLNNSHNNDNDNNGKLDKKVGNKLDVSLDENGNVPTRLVWFNIGLFVILHSCLPIALYMLYTQRPWFTFAYSIIGVYISGLGVTAGAHRLWSHKSYKARLPVQLILIALQTMAGQNSIFTWCRDHRLHHKFSETNADPHNIKRGFFFAHMGWLCCKKHPQVKEKGRLINMSDLESDKLVMFQHRHFWWLAALFTVVIPTLIPIIFWNESFWTSFIFGFMVRYLVTLHGTWLVNSAAHYVGSRPYDINIEARESPYAIYNALGEGFHNYHHTFPYDYATSEFGRYFNITTMFIDACASIGLVYNRRQAETSSITRRRQRTGDLSEQAKELEEQARRLEAKKSTACSKSEGLNLIHELPYISGLTSMKYTM